MSLHPWHSISPGQRAPHVVDALIEISKGSKGKYELDKASGLLRLDRVIYASSIYPSNYGFIPQTYGGDNDPLDILVLSQIEIQPLCLVQSRVIGVMQMLDQGEDDDKIIAVAEGDPLYHHVTSMDQLAPHTLAELRNFFEEYKKLENKAVKVETFGDAEMATEIILSALQYYQVTFGKKS